MQTATRWPLFLSLMLLAALLASINWRYDYLDNGLPYNQNDFAHYYVAARSVLVGADPYLVNLDSEYEKYRFSNDPKLKRPTNPPALVLLTVPLALLPPYQAFVLWSTVQLLSLLAAVFITTRIVLGRWEFSPAFMLLLLALPLNPVLSHLYYGQTQMLMLFLFTCGLYFVKDGRAAGAALWGFATALKLFTFPAIVAAYKSSGKEGAFAFIAGFLAPYLLSFVLLGFSVNINFVSVALPDIAESAARTTGNKGLGYALWGTPQVWRGGIYYDSYSLISTVSACVVLLIYLAMAVRMRSGPGSAAAHITLALCCSLLAAPTSWIHYYVLLLLPFTLYFLESAPFIEALPKMAAAYLLLGIIAPINPGESQPAKMLSLWSGVAAALFYAALFYRRNSRKANGSRL
ncbi:MAG: DUF2029 domain-containing protein [Deltaproteobacteria bacterium]|nr:DUF2029 domain-containing protein [Deltaproteobacteria bacterium]